MPLEEEEMWIRQAQVAGANATAVAYNQGVGNSSALTGAFRDKLPPRRCYIQGMSRIDSLVMRCLV